MVLFDFFIVWVRFYFFLVCIFYKLVVFVIYFFVLFCAIFYDYGFGIKFANFPPFAVGFVFCFFILPILPELFKNVLKVFMC